jgi:hypothetical protein
MRPLVLFFAALATAAAADTIGALGYQWEVPAAADWSGAPDLLRMLVPHPDAKQLPRRPVHYAVAKTPAFEEVTVEVEVKRIDKGSLILVYAWRDAGHFNYAHLSPDAPSKQPVHSGMFHVYNGDRVRISSTDGPPTLLTNEWTPVRLTYSARTHLCEVAVNGEKLPSLKAIDLSLGAGRIGLGSFFNNAEFRRLVVRGK